MLPCYPQTPLSLSHSTPFHTVCTTRSCFSPSPLHTAVCHTAAHLALLVNVHCKEPLVCFKVSGLYYIINPESSLRVLSAILLLPQVMEIQQLWFQQLSSALWQLVRGRASSGGRRVQPKRGSVSSPCCWALKSSSGKRVRRHSVIISDTWRYVEGIPLSHCVVASTGWNQLSLTHIIPMPMCDRR